VLDFGISKVALTGSAFETDVPLVRTMMPMGSPVYMSPEQIRAWDDIDARTDIWSLGCVLFELLTGKSAFDAPSITQLSATILEQHPPPLRSLCPGAPAELEALVSRCLEKDRDKRFRNVAELAIALYPFGPRRARISAERCSFVLKSAGISQAEFELPSMPPPGWKDADSASAIPVENSPYRTSGPATMTMKDIPNFRGSSGSKRALFLGLGVALVAAGYAFARSHGSVASLASATAPPAAVTPAVVAPFAPTAENVPPPVGTGASIGTPEATATAARSAAATTATSKSKPSSPSPPTAKPKGPPPPTKPGGTTGKDELDVGF
jgi:serine/threonine protein kinase